MLKYILILSVQVAYVAAFGQRANITITGFVGCGRYSLPNAVIELYERDPFDPDDLLNRTKTNQFGHFSISGNEKEIGKECSLIDRYPVPRRFYGKVYDMGIISLNIPTVYRWQTCSNPDN
uniref:Transthyretin-like family protein n=1 Tax=Syphacia muris TaxID=451379 RepID=A0A0N5AV87_9BILA